MTTANAMSIELVKILEAAQDAYDRSMRYFAYMEDENDPEMKNIYWARCQEYDGMCAAYKHSYEILTGKHIQDYEIKKELALA